MRGLAVVAAAVGCTAFAVPIAASTPPARALLVDVNRGTVGGLALGQSASAFVQRLGAPDYSGSVESQQSQEMLWSLTPATTTAWAVVSLRSSTRAGEFRYGGRFRTASGDGPGTTLDAFKQHWKPAGSVRRVVRSGATIEYDVTVGRVVFAFDKNMKLKAVGLVPVSAGTGRCIIPSLCVTSPLG